MSDLRDELETTVDRLIEAVEKKDEASFAFASCQTSHDRDDWRDAEDKLYEARERFINLWLGRLRREL